jgi:hypothetical protein
MRIAVVHALALAPTFVKGIAVIVAAFVLFIGSVYVLLTAVFGLRMGYLVLAVSFFGWMIILSLVWTIGQPKILGVTGTLPNLGPRGTEKHWQVVAAGTGNVVSPRFPLTTKYPLSPWHEPNAIEQPSVSSVSSAIQKYMVAQAQAQLSTQRVRVCPSPVPGEIPSENCLSLDPTTFIVQDIRFTTDGGTPVVGAHSFFTKGGPEVTVFAYRDSGNLPVYSIAFLIASILGFAVHVPFLDRAEKKRKAILTGGTAPPWFGPA